MQRNKFSLKNVCETLVAGFSHSTVAVCIVLLVFTVLTTNCGSPTKYHIPETVATTTATKAMPTESRITDSSLPKAAAVNLRELPYVRNVFKETPDISRGGLDDFYLTTRGKVQHVAIVSNCSFNVLKAFVAKGWTPIVMVQLQGRKPEILPMSRYDDRSGEVSLQHLVNFGERRVSYKNFERDWTISRNKCVLITPQQLSETTIRKVLSRYLPTEEELLIHEVLGSVQLPTNLTENIVRQVADINPASPPASKPPLPWAAFGTATVLVILLLGVSSQYIARFQKPYSFEAQSEPTIEIVEAPIVLDTTSKPDVRNRLGRVMTPGRNDRTSSQVSETVNDNDSSVIFTDQSSKAARSHHRCR